MALFTDINILNLTITQVPKHAGVLSPSDYLTTVTTLPNGHDYATVVTQANNPVPPYPSNYAKLNIAGHFIKGNFREELDQASGLTIQILPYYVNILSPGCESITVENAYDKFVAFRDRLAELSGIVEFNAWINYYMNENFTMTHDAFIDASDSSVEWWIDHDIAYTKINNAV